MRTYITPRQKPCPTVVDRCLCRPGGHRRAPPLFQPRGDFTTVDCNKYIEHLLERTRARAYVRTQKGRQQAEKLQHATIVYVLLQSEIL